MMGKCLSFYVVGKGRKSIPDCGCYVLLLTLDKRISIRVGALGRIRFPPGQYAYVGRAGRNLAARISRHLRGPKRVRWHIDYLRKEAGIAAVGVTASLAECSLAATLAALPGAGRISRFGVSDCRCPSHLIAVTTAPPLSELGLTEVPLAAFK